MPAIVDYPLSQDKPVRPSELTGVMDRYVSEQRRHGIDSGQIVAVLLDLNDHIFDLIRDLQPQKPDD